MKTIWKVAALGSTLTVLITIFVLVPSPKARQVTGAIAAVPAYFTSASLTPIGGQPISGPDTDRLVSLFNQTIAAAQSATNSPDPRATRRAIDNELCAELESFLTNYPASAWGPSVHLLLARRANMRCGYSLALNHYEAAFSATTGSRDQTGQGLGGEAVAGLSRMFMLTGHTSDFDALKSALPQLGVQPLGSDWGLAMEMRDWNRKHPNESFKCGLYCLEQLGRLTQPGQFSPKNIIQISSSTNGYTAGDLVTYGGNAGLRLHAALLSDTNNLPVPCILHLRCEHFVFLREQRGAFYNILDTVAEGSRWLTAQDLAPELTGCVLVSDVLAPVGSAPLESLDATRAALYRGRCCPQPAPSDHNAPPPCIPDDTHCCLPGGSGPGPGPGSHGPGLGPSVATGLSGSSGPTAMGIASCISCGGMPVFGVVEPYLLPWIIDAPLQYTPAYGLPVEFRLAYHNRNAGSVVSLYPWQGAQIGNMRGARGVWSCSWLSFAEVDTSENTVDIMMPAGGWATFSFPTGSLISSINYRDNTWLEKETDHVGTLEGLLLHFPDGSLVVYDQADYSTAIWENFSVLYYMSAMRNPATSETTFAYDLNHYLTNVTASDGTSFTLHYTNSTYSALITSVTASYGASVSLAYDTAPMLTNITDTAGISSGIVYSDNTSYSGDFTKLITPYGTTLFSMTPPTGGSVFNRFVQITNAVGTQEFYGWISGNGDTGWPDFDSSQIPTNTSLGTLDADTGTRQWRNSFYWNAQQFASLVSRDLSTFGWDQFKTARIRHWLNDSFDNSDYGHYGTLSLEQAPSPDGGTTQGQITWYDYNNKYSGENDEAGTQSWPSVIARVMPDGSTWFQSFQRLTNGLPTKMTEQWIQNGGVSNRVDSFLYDANNTDLLAWTNALGVAAQVNVYNASHQVCTNYDALNEITTNGYDASTHQLTSVSRPSGLVTIYTYDGTTHRLTEADDLPITGRTNTFTWHSDGTLATQTDPRGLTTTYYWDALHRPTGTAYPDGTTTTNRYDLVSGTPYPNSSGGTAILDLTAAKDRLGYWTYFTYDAIRRQIFVTNANHVVIAYGFCDCGSISAMTNALGTAVQQVTTYTHDYQGNRLETFNADGYNVVNNFDSLGRMTNTTDGAVSRTFNYNNIGLLVSATAGAVTEQQTTYDILGRPVHVTDVNGVIATNTYDNLDRVLTRGYPDGGVEQFYYSARGLIAYTNQLGLGTEYAYDAASRKTYETNANNELLRFTNSGAGDLLSLTDGKTQTTRWVYDQYGRVTNKFDQVDSSVLQYNYDADNRLTNRWSAAKGNTYYKYDPVGNLTNIVYPSDSPVVFAYDSLNRLTNMVDGIGATKYTYTAAGQLHTEGGLFGNDTVTNIYSNRRRVALGLQQATGSWTNAFAWDGAGRLTNVISPAGNFAYTYDALRSTLPNRLGLPNGSYITNYFDSNARTLATLLKNSGNTTLDSALYGYNVAGQRTTYTNAAGTYVQFAYDPISQLKVATSSDSSENVGYTYDSAWNLNYVTNSSGLNTFTVDSDNQLTSRPVSGSSPCNTCTYDANGNLVNACVTSPFDPPYGGIATCCYDDENRLVRWMYADEASYPLGCDDSPQSSSDHRTDFIYDGLGRLRSRIEYFSDGLDWQTLCDPDYSETDYIYDGWRVIQARDACLGPVSYTRGRDLSGTFEGAGGIGGLLARSDSNGHAYYHPDGNGNITCLIDGSQTVVASYRYDPFGNTISSSGDLSVANTYRFSSKECHVASGMYYFGYRFYDPSLQRWITADPVAERGFLLLDVRSPGAVVFPGEQAWGFQKPLYVFIGNSPLNFIDPMGLDFTPNGRVTLDKNCTKAVFGINNDDPKYPWQWVPIKGTGISVGVDGIGWIGPDGKQHGWKIPNTHKCKIHCDKQGYPSSFECKCWAGAPKARPWKPGGGPPDNLPPVPGDGTYD